jgi:hypothetical protein
MTGEAWSATWRSNIDQWLDQHRGFWRALAEGPQRLLLPSNFGVTEVNTEFYEELVGIVDVTEPTLRDVPDVIRATFVRAVGPGGGAGSEDLSDQIGVLSSETYLHVLGMLEDAIGGETL